MLDFSKKRTMPLILGDGTKIDLRTPNAKTLNKLTKIGGEPDDYVEACVIILNLNQQGLTFTADEVAEDLGFDEMVILSEAYLSFVADIQNDPNYKSRLAQQMREQTGQSTTTR